MKLEKLIYGTGIKVLNGAIKVAALFNNKAKLFAEGRKNIFSTIEAALEGRQEKRVWFHCSSLGEFEQGRPVIEKFKEEFPDYEIFLTFYSPSGYEVRKNYALAKYVFYLPIDSQANATRLVELVNPQIAFFIKYEFWFYYLQELNQKKIPILSISAIFREEQLFFKSYGGFYRQMLHYFSHIFVQNRASKELLEEIKVNKVSVSGDTRFDRVVSLPDTRKTLPLIEAFADKKPTLVIGSSWKEDMAVLLPFINKNKYGLKYIIAPHEISENNIKVIQLSSALPTIRLSEATLTSVEKFDVLLIDNVGMLSSLYAYGVFAYIGGGLGKGLHNILEAATYGIPVVFGNKNYMKFQEAKDLIGLGGAFSVGEPEELDRTFERLKTDDFRKKAGSINKNYVREHVGATDKIISYCKELLKPKEIGR